MLARSIHKEPNNKPAEANRVSDSLRIAGVNWLESESLGAGTGTGLGISSPLGAFRNHRPCRLQFRRLDFFGLVTVRCGLLFLFPIANAKDI